ncbi:MAG: hypothetical protein ACI4DO_07620, partial [Roseburia sp.]
MKSIRKKFRKGTAILLVCSMIVGIVTAMPGNVASVKAGDGDTIITSVKITVSNPPKANTPLEDISYEYYVTGVKVNEYYATGISDFNVELSPTDSIANYNTSYIATFALTAADDYQFAGNVTVSGLDATGVKVIEGGKLLTLTYVFPATAKRKITGVTAPTVPTDNTFTTYYGYEGYDEVLSDVGNSELGKQAMVTLEDTELVASTTEAMNVTWAIANADDAGYDSTPGATNIFRWTISDTKVKNYDITGCSSNYDSNTKTITGTFEIKNKAATPVTITGTDSSVAYTGETIDVSQYFTIDSHAGTATYALVTGADGGTGEGSLDGSTLTVTKTGTFKIKGNTAANGIYAAGEETITLTVDNGTIEYTAADYSGTYDGQGHSISVNVINPEGTTVTYSTDGTTYGD